MSGNECSSQNSGISRSPDRSSSTQRKPMPWIDSINVFCYGFQDCTLYQHVFQDASRPASKANPQAVSLNSKGDVMYACRVNMNPVRGSAKLSSILRKGPLHSEQFCQASSVMHRFLCKSPRETQCFHECARRYILTGRPFADICDHNAAVAKDLNRHHVSNSLACIIC